MMKIILCLLLPALVVSFDKSSETNKEKTTEAVVKAVANVKDKVESKEEKKATAVADATIDVIKSESDTGIKVSDDIMEKAKQEAKKTFEQLDEAKVGTKASADAAAKVAVAEVDGASDLQVEKGVKENAEKAAIAAGKGLADHPDSEGKALKEAITTVQKEEDKSGKVDVKKTEKGVIAKAKDAVSELPSMAEGAAADVVPHGGMGAMGFVVIFAGTIGVASIGYKYYEETLSQTIGLDMGKFFNRAKNFEPEKRDVEFGGPMYSQYSEMH